MDVTTFLAQLWGPTLVVIAVGILSNRAFYTRVYRDLEKAPLTSLIFGFVAMIAGTASVLFHNTWTTLDQFVISFLGWATFLKGALFVLAPKWVDKMGDQWSKKRMIPVAALLCLIVGGYVSWIGYF